MILKDKGDGITEESLEFFWDNRKKLGEITEVKMFNHRDELYPLRLKDINRNEIWLSGCNAGFCGEGPSGTLRLLEELDLLHAAARTLVTRNASFVLKVQGG